MDQRFEFLFPALWAAWALYWWAASFDVKRTARRESVASRLSHIVPLEQYPDLLNLAATRGGGYMKGVVELNDSITEDRPRAA